MSSQPLSPPVARTAIRHTRQAGIPRWHAAVAFWSFVSPLLIGLVVFTFIPIVWGFYLSLHEARATITPQQFVGLRNYQQMLSDPEFIRSLVMISLFAIFIVPTTLALSLLLAILVNTATFGKGFFRSVFFIPTACSYVVASLVWRMSLFSGMPYGFVNMVLYPFGIEPIAWIGTTSPPWYWLVIISVRLWLQTGFYMIIFLAGLQEIPAELYEAARVDGARSGVQTFRFITLPLLRNTMISVMLLCLIGAFQAFDEFYNILGGNIVLARPPLVYLFNVAFGAQNYGVGSAGAFILTALIMLFTVVQGRLFGFGKSEY